MHRPPLRRFCGATDKSKTPWFWGSNKETVAVILMTKSPNRSCWFWGSNQKTLYHISFEAQSRNRRHRFWGQTGENRPSGFEVKPLINRQSWFWGSTKKLTLLVSMCTVQTAQSVTWPLDCPAIEYPICATIPSPLHQVSYSCHDPHHCISCRTCHLHTTR
jgi:hypothetical protein